MRRDKIQRIAEDFRRGILGTMPSTQLCFAVCAPLQGFLSSCGHETELIEGEIERGERVVQHYWLKLKDGRILDPTADQFKTPTGEPMPEVYIGEQPEWYRMCRELTIEDAKNCVKGGCAPFIVPSAFGGFYVRCDKCKKSAGIAKSESKAVETWNRWLELGNGRI